MPTGSSVRRTNEPFDANELCRRLEVYRQEQKLAKLRRDHKLALKSAEKTGGFVPRVAAKQFQATTTVKKPTDGGKENEKRPAESHSTRLDDERIEHVDTTGNLKRALAAKILQERNENRTTTSISVPSLNPVGNKNKENQSSSIKRRDSQALRARELNQAYNGPRIRPRPLSTALENLSIEEPEETTQSNVDIPLLCTSPPPKEEERPPLRPHDRPNWAQGSQVDLHQHMLHVPSSWKRGDKGGNNEQQQQGQTRASAGVVGRGKPRQKSHGDTPENLVGEAVKLIRHEERTRRRSSILGMFKRH